MGLRDLFRSSKHDMPTPQPSPGERPTEPGHDAASAAQDPRPPHQDAAAQGTGRRRPEQDATPLPEKGALRNLVELLLSRGADRARLTLVQSGNIMTHQTRQSVEEGQDEVENGTVDQGSPLFDDVAELYTQAMSTPVGPWRQLDLVVAAPDEGRRDVTVSYDFPNGESRTEHFTHGQPRTEDARGTAGSADGSTLDARDEHAPTTATGAAAGGAAGAGLAGGEHRDPQEHSSDSAPATGEDGAVRLVDEHGTQPAESGDVVAAGHTSSPVLADSPETDDAVHNGAAHGEASPHGSPATGAPESHEGAAALAGTTAGAGLASAVGTEQHSQDSDVTRGTDTADDATRRDDSALREDTVVGTPPQDRDAEHRGAEDRVPGAEQDAVGSAGGAPGAEELPAHVDESEFGAGTAEPLVPAGATMDLEDDPASAPGLATATDVSPSYRAPQAQPELDPNALAPGNLVLTTGDVLARLADAQRHLFGEGGTARDVSTVLIRVRALGTYYDALTHVRLNGFWDQRPTFELVPEDLLKVQELKDDSYVEGSGAPLAMMFRFRPGVPPEISFDYSDEEAFVRYEQRLPGQNYLEELRMYPRTGSSIPQHVNEALQDWNY